MGATSADTQREINEIRQDVVAAAAELDRRVQHALDLPARGRDIGWWLSEQAAERPLLAVGVGLGVIAGATLLGLRAAHQRRQRSTVRAQVERLASEARDEASRRLEQSIEQAQEFLQATRGRDQVKQLDQGDSGMVKKLLWAGLTAASMALAGLLARRLSVAVWQAIMREEPPTSNV